MTYEEREKIFSKDTISIKELADLLGLSYSKSAELIRQIKFKFNRLDVQGVLHVEDYFDYFKITDRQRYLKQQEVAI